jgi:hypothetical protein
MRAPQIFIKEEDEKTKWLIREINKAFSSFADEINQTNKNVELLTLTNRVDVVEEDVVDLDTELGAQASAISTLDSEVSTIDGEVTAVASSVTTLSATVAGNTAAISSEASARATADGYLAGKYTLTATAGNVVTGMNITSSSGAGTNVSEVTFQTDKFKIYNGSTGQTPFLVSGGNVYIDNARIKDLEATSIKAGTITANEIINLGISTAKIADGALSSMYSDENGSFAISTGNTYAPVGVSSSGVSLTTKALLIASFQCNDLGGATTPTVRASIQSGSGTTLVGGSRVCTWIAGTANTYSVHVAVPDVLYTSYRLYFDNITVNTSAAITNCFLSLVEFKK